MMRDVTQHLDVGRVPACFDVSLVVHHASMAFPRVEQYGGIADQLRRSSKSVCALLTEGGGRQQAGNDIEFRRYVRMALGSAEESKLWCKYAEDLGYITPEQGMAWQEEYSGIGRMLNGLLRHLASPMTDSRQLTTDR